MNDSDKTKEQLLEELELLRLLMDNLPDRLYVKDKEGRFVICNKAVAEDTDHPFSGNPIGKTDFDLFPPELAGTLYAAEQEIIKTGKPMVNEEVHRIRLKDGKTNWALSTKLPWRDKNGNIIGIIGANRDITERKTAEQALQESEARYKAILESAVMGIIFADARTRRFMYANPAACEMFGYTAEELSHKGVDNIHPKEWLDQAKRDFDGRAGGDRKITRDAPCLRKDGSIFYADINTANITIGNKPCLVGFFTDITEHKRTEDALRESEARYRTIFESAREGIVVGIFETRRFMYANPAICKMFGYTAEEFTRLTVDDIHPKEHLQYVSDRFGAFMRGEALFTPNLPCLCKNGTVFYADISATRIIINDKDCFVGFCTDTNERKQTEEALRESEARYKAIFNSATEGIVVTDVETKRHRYANPAFCRMFGYTAEEFQKMSVYDIHPKEYMSSVIAGFDAQARGEKTLVPDVPCLHRNGTVFYADIDTTCVVIDHRPCNVGLFTNITERKQAEEALRQSEEKFRGLAERSFDMVFTTDAKGFITYLSPASERIFGYTTEEMVGKHFANFLKESEIPKATKRFMEKLQGRDHGNLLLEAKKKDGSSVFIELISSLIMQDGAIQGTQGIIRDITDRKKAEEELRKAHDELEARVRKRTADLAMAVEKLQNEIAERKRAEESLRNAERRFRTIFENTVVGLYRTTPDGRVLMANPALVKMLGYKSFEELAKVNLEKKGLDPSTPRSTFKKLIEKKGKIIGLESIWIKRDGTRLYVSESAFAARDSNGNILYYEGTAQDITKRKEAEEKLLQYQEQLRSLASQQSLADEQLRRRIASELHDHISQDLAISKMKLESLADPAKSDLNASLKEVIGLIAHTIDVSRSLTFEMSPPVLYELGFEAAIGWLVNQTRKRFGINAEFTDDGKPKILDDEVRVTLFQAVRELLVNVVKHAKARIVKVSTSLVRGGVQITVEDDGIGFVALGKAGGSSVSHKAGDNDDTSGFGLFNIRERLNHIGGKVNIRSKPGKGTRVTLIVPLNTKNTKTKRSKGVKK